MDAEASVVEMYGWGRGDCAVLGVGDSDDRHRPVRVSLSGVLELTRVYKVSCSWYHSLALTDMGLVYSWGSGSDGALGHGGVEDHSRPRLVEAFGDGDEDEDDENTALNGGGGGGGGGGAGGGAGGTGGGLARTGPQEATLIIDVACGADLLGAHSVAVSREGRVYSWGNGAALGVGTMRNRDTPKMIWDGLLSRERVMSVDAGGSFTLALTDTGSLYSWGKWANGRLGLGALPKKQESISSRTLMRTSI